MNITYNGTTLDLLGSLEKVPDKIFVKVSGGLDSAALLYLLCKHYPNMSIKPVTLNEVNTQVDALCAKDVVSFMRERFPEVNIEEHLIIDYNDKDNPEYYERVHRYLNGRTPQDVGFSTVRGLVKVRQIHDIMKGLIAQEPDRKIFEGMTKAPPIETAKELGIYDLVEPRRFNDVVEKGVISISPFRNQDKRFIAAIYKDEGLMEDLYPLTNSCVGSPSLTDYFTKVCGKCFWCHEKKWAFDLEDFE